MNAILKPGERRLTVAFFIENGEEVMKLETTGYKHPLEAIYDCNFLASNLTAQIINGGKEPADNNPHQSKIIV